MSDSPTTVRTTDDRRPRGGWRVAMDRAEPLIELAIKLCGWSSIFFVFAIFFFVFWEAKTALFGGVSLIEFFTSIRWQPTSEVRPEYGILALLVGTVSVTALAMVIAVPLGLGAAVFISEFCSGKTKETLKIVIELLAAIPSIVWGVHRLHGPRTDHYQNDRRGRGRESAQRRHYPRTDERADHRLGR